MSMTQGISSQSSQALIDLQRGLDYAMADDGRIGPNDVDGLTALAQAAGRPDLAAAITQAATSFQPAPVRKTRIHSGYAKRVVSFEPGTGRDFNQDKLELVLGRPEGAGDAMGSLHVVSLGQGGQITVELGRPARRGLKVFENPFKTGGQVANPEPARVEVSEDGISWFTLRGQAGFSPVYLNSVTMMNPRGVSAGGDSFSFRDAGVPPGTAVRFVRITDLGSNFDLDAVYGY